MSWEYSQCWPAMKAREKWADCTRQWTLSEADVLAVRDGYWFDWNRANYAITWIEENCILYEGDWAGSPLILDDWQYTTTAQIFGWVGWSRRWGRPVRRFTHASIWVPKKNKKSPTLAAWGLYLLYADGEQGQKVFLCAKDGRQAREIAGKHAIEMVKASPLLDHFGRINKTEMSITVEGTKSVMRPLASANIRSQKAQEGLNGCILVDETHVVDADYMARLARAGISRSEPLQIEASTVGDDPGSYGMEQFNIGREVEAGRLKNHRLLFVCYAAPQMLSDKDLANDPLKYGMMANPAMRGNGYATSAQTIDPEEFLNDFKTSRVSPSKLARFKMYRLNIWQRSSEPWLSMVHWERNTRDFAPVDLRDRWCTWGLDLSRGMDLTALAAIFPEMDFEEFAGRLEEAAVDNKTEGGNGEGGEDGWSTAKIVPEDVPCRMLAWYWIPEGTVERQEHMIEWRTWERQGWITIQKNTDITRYDLIEADMGELLKMFDVRMLSFDGKYATELVTRLVLFHGFDEDNLYVFPQNMKNFCAPTAKFERLVLGGMLHPNGNALLKWQAGNVRTWEDANENKRPIKEKRHDIRTIDGIVGGVMGLDGLTRVESADYGAQVL